MSQGDAVLFENADWTVTSAGLEHKGNGYFIEREHLDSRRADEFWTWPLHMLEKTWCAPHAFAEAFGVAVRAYGLADCNLTASFVAAFRSRLGPRTAAVMRRRTGAPPLRRADRAGAEEPSRTAGWPQPRLEPRLPVARKRSASHLNAAGACRRMRRCPSP